MDKNYKREPLAGRDAIKLWLRGKDVWNKWVDKYPERDVNFSGVDFDYHCVKNSLGEVSFLGFKFPKGNVRFDWAKFGNRNVSFKNADFNDGELNFCKAEFGIGNVDFSGSKLGRGGALFYDVNFGSGDVSFEKVTFNLGEVNFCKARFGSGRINFDKVKFGGGKVLFNDTIFGSGDISFESSVFEEGRVSFFGVFFGVGKVSFEKALFSNVNFSFVKAIFLGKEACFREVRFLDSKVFFADFSFGVSDVSFYNAQFGDGDLSFFKVNFGTGSLSFVDAQFGDNEVLFSCSEFGNKKINFMSAQFGNSTVSFEETNFGDGDVIFKGCRFGEGSVAFYKTIFGAGDYIFERIVCKSTMFFLDVEKSEYINLLSFRYSSFDRSLSLFDMNLNCVPDLTQTNISNNFSLEGITYKLNMVSCNILVDFVCDLPNASLQEHLWSKLAAKIKNDEWITKSKAADKSDIDRLRRLKEIADSNKDHARALKLHVDEMKAKRWHETIKFKDLALEFLFDKLSDYGRSEFRPLGYMSVVWLLFSVVYTLLSTNYVLGFGKKFGEAMVFSGGQMLALIPSSRDARMEGIDILFCGDLPSYVYMATFLQSLISIVLLFLIGLALRNRFRV